MTLFLKDFLTSDNGATAIEYGLIASLIAIGLVGAVSGLGDQISAFLVSVSTDLATQTAP